MELPPMLRAAVEEALAGASTERLAGDAAALSARYRGEVHDGRLHVGDDDAARAYLATRLPATYASARRAIGEAADRLPGFRPASLLDLGSGPGTMMHASADAWSSLARATLVETSAAMRRQAEHLAKASPVAAEWHDRDLAGRLPDFAPHDLVTIGYVLDELMPEQRASLIEAAWQATSGLLLLVEPGTPAGWRRIVEARAALIALGARIAAPCPHEAPCPVVSPDWCHFAARVARSRVHLRAKQGSVPFEDEKFIYLAATRLPIGERPARVLAPPQSASGRVSLKLCLPQGDVSTRLVTRREGEVFRRGRRVDWGDAIEM